MLRRFPSYAAVACAAGLALTACGAPGESGDSGSSGSGPIKIAVVDAQSGQLSSLGDWEYKGAKLAVDQWNAKGGVNGRKVKLSVYDDQGDPTVGTNVARKVTSQQVVAVLGTAESSVTEAIAPILESAKVPEITSGQAPDLAGKSPYLFLNSPTSVTYDETLAKYLVGDKGFKRIAMISNNGAYGKGEHDAFLAALKARGAKPVSDQVVTADQKDFSAQLTKIGQAKPDVVFIGAEEVESGLIAKQARSLGVTAPIAGAAPIGTSIYLDTAGGKAAEGSIVSSPYLGNDVSAASRTFAAAYKKAYGKDAELHGAKAYDGAQILLTALKNDKGATGQKLADAIRAVRYKGLMGDFEFDKLGVGITKTEIGVVKGGKVTPAS